MSHHKENQGHTWNNQQQSAEDNDTSQQGVKSSHSVPTTEGSTTTPSSGNTGAGTQKAMNESGDPGRTPGKAEGNEDFETEGNS